MNNIPTVGKNVIEKIMLWKIIFKIAAIATLLSTIF